jgi:hypothetical protein
LRACGTGEGAALVAEELALEQGFGQAGAVHHHQRPGCGARAGLVHGARHQLLAGARFAQQQHAGVRRADPRHQLQHGCWKAGARPIRPCAGTPRATGSGSIFSMNLRSRPAASRSGTARCSRSPRPRRVVQVQHALALPDCAALRASGQLSPAWSQGTL